MVQHAKEAGRPPQPPSTANSTNTAGKTWVDSLLNSAKRNRNDHQKTHNTTSKHTQMVVLRRSLPEQRLLPRKEPVERVRGEQRDLRLRRLDDERREGVQARARRQQPDTTDPAQEVRVAASEHPNLFRCRVFPLLDVDEDAHFTCGVWRKSVEAERESEDVRALTGSVFLSFFFWQRLDWDVVLQNGARVTAMLSSS